MKISLLDGARTFCQRFALALAVGFTLPAHAVETAVPATAEASAEVAPPAPTQAPAPAPIQTQTTTPATAPVIATHPLNMAWGILFLLALVGAAWWLIRRSGGLQLHAGRGMKVVAALQVGPRERVVLIDIAGQQWLLGVAPGNVNLLQHFEQPVLQNAGSDDFASKIRAVLQQGVNR